MNIKKKMSTNNRIAGNKGRAEGAGCGAGDGGGADEVMTDKLYRRKPELALDQIRPFLYNSGCITIKYARLPGA